jgi:hypothetical protein
MSAVALRAVTGAHLTATDKRNIAAVLAHPGFVAGQRYQVNGRKSYVVTVDADGRHEVATSETEIDGYGRRLERTYRSQFRVAAR